MKILPGISAFSRLDERPRALRVLAVLYAVSIALLYLLLREYNPYRMDDGWFASMIYQSYKLGVRTDVVFGGSLENGLGGTQLFGMAYAAFYGAAASAAHCWDKHFFYLISEALVLGSALLWWRIALRLRMPVLPAALFALSLAYADVFLSTARSVRTEAFVLFFCSLALFLAQRRFYALALLAGAVAVETHPIGGAAFFLIGPLIVYDWDYVRAHRPGVLVRLALAGLSCAAAYFWAHPGALELFTTARHASGGWGWQNSFLYDYYFKTRYHRKIPELFFLLIAVALYFRSPRDREDRLVFAWFAGMILFAVLLGRSTLSYAVVVYPVFGLLIFRVARRAGLLCVLLAVFWLLWTPQYALLYRMNHGRPVYSAYSGEYTARVKDRLKAQSLPVIGLPNDYFNFTGDRFYNQCYWDLPKFAAEVTTGIWIRHDRTEHDKYSATMFCDNLRQIETKYDTVRLETFHAFGQSVAIYRIDRR